MLWHPELQLQTIAIRAFAQRRCTTFLIMLPTERQDDLFNGHVGGRAANT